MLKSTNPHRADALVFPDGSCAGTVVRIVHPSLDGKPLGRLLQYYLSRNASPLASLDRIGHNTLSITGLIAAGRGSDRFSLATVLVVVCDFGQQKWLAITQNKHHCT